MLLPLYGRPQRMDLFFSIRSHIPTESSALHLSAVATVTITRVQTVISSAGHIRGAQSSVPPPPRETEHRGKAEGGEARWTYAHRLWLLSVNIGETSRMSDEDALGQGTADVTVAGCREMQRSGMRRRRRERSERRS